MDFSSLLYQPEALPGARGDAKREAAKGAMRQIKGRASPLARLLLHGSEGRRGFGADETADPEYWGTASVLVETRAP